MYINTIMCTFHQLNAQMLPFCLTLKNPTKYIRRQRSILVGAIIFRPSTPHDYPPAVKKAAEIKSLYSDYYIINLVFFLIIINITTNVPNLFKQWNSLSSMNVQILLYECGYSLSHVKYQIEFR